MADNFIANPGVGGDTFASDDIGGIQYPRSKVGWGADGVYGDVSLSNPLPVELTDGVNPVVVKVLSSAPVDTDAALMTQSVIHGRSTAGGGTFVDVKVNPSGSLAADVSGSTNVGITAVSLPLPTGAATEATLSALNAKQPSIGGPALSANAQPVDLAFRATSGSIAALNASVQIDVSGMSTVAFDVRGTFTATLTFQYSGDGGTTWTSLTAIANSPVANFNTTTSGSAAGSWVANCSGLRLVRVIATAYTSGTANVNIHAATGPGVVAAIPANGQILGSGTAAIGDVGIQYRANASGAASGAHIVSAATTNATIVKASAGRVLGWALGNTTAAWRYVKLHNQTTLPTAGSGVVRTISIPPGGLAQQNLPGGIAFTTGIGLTIVTGSADADATAVALGDVVGELFFS